MNIHCSELLLTVMQGNIGDTGGGGMGGEELGKHLSYIIVLGVQKSCSST